MDIFSLKCFIVLSEQLNFTQTAQIVHISQPSLSRIVHNMEDELSVVLFHRGKNGITLTEAGKEFRKNIKPIVKDYDQAIVRTKAIDLNVDGHIRLGFVPIMCMKKLPVFVSRFHELFPDVEIEVLPLTIDETIAELNAGVLDFALITDWKLEFLQDCESEVIFLDKYMVALHKDNPLAAKDIIEIEDLKEENVLFYKDKGDLRTEKKDSLFSLHHSITLDNVLNAKQISDFLGLLTLLECNQGVGIFPSHVETYLSDNIMFKEYNYDAAMFHGNICWKKDNKDIRIETARRILKEVFSS